MITSEVDRLATAIGGHHADAAQREQALIIAESELALLRVRAVRTQIFEQILSGPGANNIRERRKQRLAPPARAAATSDIDKLKRLERYERRSFSRRRRAIQKFLALQGELAVAL
jgi:hypothetical protein